MKASICPLSKELSWTFKIYINEIEMKYKSCISKIEVGVGLTSFIVYEKWMKSIHANVGDDVYLMVIRLMSMSMTLLS